jgi:hypothetical protein
MDAGGETFETEVETSTAGKESVFWVLEIVLFGVVETFGKGVAGEIGPFGEDEEPHGIVCSLSEFLETMSQTRFICFPITSHED